MKLSHLAKDFYSDLVNKIFYGDCLEIMPKLPDGIFDMILCDLPYGTTANKWDTVISLPDIWKNYERVMKPGACIVLTGREPFSSLLRTSNPVCYRYDWIWVKSRPGRYVQAKKMPLSYFENICVFYYTKPVYNPIFTEGKPYQKNHVNSTKPNYGGEENRNGSISVNEGTRYPSDVLFFANSNTGSLHPTQKPVALFEYLIKTYTNEGALVLDNCAGSETTAIACKNTNRNYTLIEKDFDYWNVCKQRVLDHVL